MTRGELLTKRIGVLGYSVNHRGVIAWLLRHGAHHVTVLVEGAVEWRAGQASSVSTIPSADPALKGVEWRLGADAFSRLTDFDVLVRTPGVRLNRRELQTAAKANVTITSQTQLFFDYCPAPIIGVTGTKGKGTTSSLIAAILTADSSLAGTTYLAGNIGVDPFMFLDQLSPHDRVVLELSSFQLQDLSKSPHIAVILGVTSDHLDYHGTREEYIAAKTSLTRYQSESDFSVINVDLTTSTKFSEFTKGQIWEVSRTKEVSRGAFVRWFGESGKRVGKIYFKDSDRREILLTRSDRIKLRGDHSLDNCMAAAAAAHLAGASLPAIQSVFQSFAGYEHRLQFIGEINGVACYDDSAATSSEPAIAAVRSFDEPIHLIVGGSFKDPDFYELGRVIVESTVATVTPLGTAEAPNIVAAIEAARKSETPRILPTAYTMAEAVKSALSQAKAGDVILLSPAAPGFDLFKNYADRGNQFVSLVREQSKEQHGA